MDSPGTSPGVLPSGQGSSCATQAQQPEEASSQPSVQGSLAKNRPLRAWTQCSEVTGNLSVPHPHHPVNIDNPQPGQGAAPTPVPQSPHPTPITGRCLQLAPSCPHMALHWAQSSRHPPLAQAPSWKQLLQARPATPPPPPPPLAQARQKGPIHHCPSEIEKAVTSPLEGTWAGQGVGLVCPHIGRCRDAQVNIYVSGAPASLVKGTRRPGGFASASPWRRHVLLSSEAGPAG